MSCSRPRRVARPEELDSDVPPGLGLMLYGYPRIPLRSILGYFPSFPTGTFWSDPKNMKIDWIRTSLGDLAHVVWLSQDSAALHPGLFSFVPSGNFVVFSSVESHEQVQKHSSGPTGRGQKCGRFPGFHPGLFSAGPSGANSSISRTQDLVMDGAHGFVPFDAAKKQVLRLPFSLFRVAQDDGLLGEGAKSEEKQVLRGAALRCVRSG